jgi:aspartate kinase
MFQITANTEVAAITLSQVPDRPGIGAQVFGSLWTRGINVFLVSSTPLAGGKANITLSVNKKDLQPALVTLKKVQHDLGADSLSTDFDVALICLESSSLTTTPGVGKRLFDILSTNKINVHAVSSSGTSLTCMIIGKDAPRAVQLLNREFEIGKKEK